ncbi:glycine-rich cell wall structural protein 1.8-like isoform X2 [Larimichthys crocea]|uniref:glycine-rich cell wall structural protein 1.8-like isoform X2 n=1 Tax=Larimichthys crocea TaxID=215358 RepID=UPI000F5EC997|nr:glycine-rich cell wall structural protein 1.8-like isoform X2 [Larimichthys crocea]
MKTLQRNSSLLWKSHIVPVAATCAELVQLSTKMMMLWLSCLLIGSITCRTLEKGPAAAPGFFWNLGRVGSSSPGSSSSLPKPSSGKPLQPSAPHVPSSAGPGNPAFSGYGAPNAASHSSGYGDSASVGNYGGGHGSSASGYGVSAPGGSYGGGYGYNAPGGSYGGGYSGYEGGSYGYVAPHDESSNFGPAIGDGAGYENPEPVFSDVSDLEPVYSYSSRSSYQRGQATFAQSRYTPGEPVPPFPVSRRSSKATFQPNAPAKAPAKGGF